MTPFRRRLLMKKQQSGEPLFYQTDLITAEVTSASMQVGDVLSWTTDQKYHFVFDWEITAVADSSTSINVRSQSQEVVFVAENNVAVGQTGHVDQTYTGNSTRNRRIFIIRQTDSKAYSINITNLKIYLAS